MNEPLRYDPYCRNCGSCEMDEWDDGKFVKYEEYARLKAEVDKLTPKKPAFFTWTDKTFIDKVEFDKLQAENEKLETEVASIGSEYMAATRHYNSLYNNLKAENERLKDELGLMHQMFEKHLTPEIRKAIINAAKGVKS